MIERFRNSPNWVLFIITLVLTILVISMCCCLWVIREMQCGNLSILDSHLSSHLCDENGVCYEPRGSLYKLFLCGEPAVTHTETPHDH